MTYLCSNCNKQVEKLITLDDSYSSASYTELLGMHYEDHQYVCVSCALNILGIDQSDLIVTKTLEDKTPFLLDLMKGNIAQILVKTILESFNYEVYPYGYENYLSTVSKSLSLSNSNISARRIRSTPDLFVFDSDSKDAFLVEVKATSLANEESFYIDKARFDDYFKYWGEAILVVYCMRYGNIYCQKIGNIQRSRIKSKVEFGKNLYILNLKDTFVGLPQLFGRVESIRYDAVVKEIVVLLRSFGKI
jgi:hypothetical protein